jgi:hypothetical protein
MGLVAQLPAWLLPPLFVVIIVVVLCRSALWFVRAVTTSHRCPAGPLPPPPPPPLTALLLFSASYRRRADTVVALCGVAAAAAAVDEEGNSGDDSCVHVATSCSGTEVADVVRVERVLGAEHRRCTVGDVLDTDEGERRALTDVGEVVTTTAPAVLVAAADAGDGHAPDAISVGDGLIGGGSGGRRDCDPHVAKGMDTLVITWPTLGCSKRLRRRLDDDDAVKLRDRCSGDTFAGLRAAVLTPLLPLRFPSFPCVCCDSSSASSTSPSFGPADVGPGPSDAPSTVVASSSSPAPCPARSRAGVAAVLIVAVMVVVEGELADTHSSRSASSLSSVLVTPAATSVSAAAGRSTMTRSCCAELDCTSTGVDGEGLTNNALVQSHTLSARPPAAAAAAATLLGSANDGMKG